jgi:hypothetical protein
MCLMNEVFREYLDKFVIVFLDYIFIYSKSEKEHENNLRKVLKVLREHKLYSKLSAYFIKRQSNTWGISFQQMG